MSTSFSPRRQTTMDFPNALREIMQGKLITKLEWNNPEVYITLHNNTLMIRRDSVLRPLLITDGDLFGEDYVETSLLRPVAAPPVLPMTGGEDWDA